jgi:hypothetical protein
VLLLLVGERPLEAPVVKHAERPVELPRAVDLHRGAAGRGRHIAMELFQRIIGYAPVLFGQFPALIRLVPRHVSQSP